MSVGDLAAHVRGGELSAREVTTAALERIEALEPSVNAFVEVDADGALAAADGIEPGDERPFAGVPIAIKANVPVAGRLDELRLEVPRRPPSRPQRLPRAAAAGGRLRDRGHHEHAGVRHPPDHRAAPHRPDPQPVGHRAHARRLLRRRGGGRGERDAARSRTATTAAARCASRPPAAAWSASSPAAGASRAGPTSATPTSPPTACSPTRWRRRRCCSTCCRATRSATRPGRRGRSSRTRSRSAATRGACASR